MIPRRVKRKLHGQIHKTLTSMQIANCYPHRPEDDSYTLLAYPLAGGAQPTSQPPVPHPSLWVNYGTTNQEYFESGREDIAKMRQILEEAGSRIETAERILEFGCAAGRLIRWLDDLATSREIWGVDIWASAILWGRNTSARHSILRRQVFLHISHSRIATSP
jgi:hypothetical protein